MAEPLMTPWLDTQWEILNSSFERLPSGILFLGPTGLGKLDLAFRAAGAWLCADIKVSGPCGGCSGCKLMAKGLHPDLHFVTSEDYAQVLTASRAQLATRYLESADAAKSTKKPKQVISVNQIRALIEKLTTHSHSGGARVVIIAPASSMNVNAANALLKVLEEPPVNTRFLLVGRSRDTLPATILSRVMVIECPVPSASVAQGWLAESGVSGTESHILLSLASGAPIAALKMYQEGYYKQISGWQKKLESLLAGRTFPVPMASEIGVEFAERFLFWLEKLLLDALCAHYGRDATPMLLDPSGDDRDLHAQLISRPLWDIIDKLQHYRRYQKRIIDGQLFLEDVLVAIWQKA